jgi:enamine deaminase RidA (YjgF/YER057c/UK114 family)
MAPRPGTVSAMSIERIEVGPRMSQAVVHNGTVYMAGVVAGDATAGDATIGVKGQTEQILATIDRVLTLAGSDKSKILKANIWLSNIADFALMNEAWDAWVPAGHTPARATVESRLASSNLLVEIMVEAAV